MKPHGLKFCELPLGPLFVLILLLASLPTVSGDPVSEDQAKAAVRGWLRADRTPLQTTVGQKVKRVEAFHDAKGTALYYVVYLDPEGFVIVAADDLIEPIIGFAPHGQFDPSTKNPLGALVSNDLPGRHASVKSIKSANARGLPLAAKNKWERLNSMDQAGPGGIEPLGLRIVSDVRVAPLTQTTWDQGTVAGKACYNYYTPPYEAGVAANYLCGCVATAMAQLMRYWQYPFGGVGTNAFTIGVNGVVTNRNLRGGDGAGGPYDWTNMVLVPGSVSTLAQRQAIGALCADAGVSAEMDYNPGGSQASPYANSFLMNTFGYANAVFGPNNSANIGFGLIGMVNPNLDAGCPVLFGISGSPGGHEVVCDGYGYNLSTLYHHLNLGWANNDTAWYNLPNIGTSAGPFTIVTDCVYNVWTNGAGEIISGRITDTGGVPIAGVLVTAARSGGGTYTATSNTNGIYALASIPSCSTYSVSASKPGYSFTQQTVTTGLSTNSIHTSGNRWAVNFPPVPDDYVYTTNNGTLNIYQYTGPGGDVVIPDKINGLPVTSVGDAAFGGCTSLKNVTVPDSLTIIGNDAFYFCTSLTNVTIGNGVTNIGDSAFGDCYALTSVTFGSSVTSIGAYAFSGSGLASLAIPDGAVAVIGSNAFDSCSALTNAVIGNGVTSIQSQAFNGCGLLKSVTIGTSVTSIGPRAFQNCTALKSVTIGTSVTSIGAYAFIGSGLTSVTIPDSASVSVGDYAFYNWWTFAQNGGA
jgi:hypothetical protein